MDNEFMNEYKKHDRKNKIYIIVIIIMFILALLFLGSKFLLEKYSTKAVFASFFENTFDSIKGNISSYSDEFKNSNIQIDSDISLSFEDKTGLEDKLQLNSISLNAVTQLDKDSNSIFGDYKYLENEEELLNFQVSYDKDKFYVFCSEIFNDDNNNELSDSVDSLVDNYFSSFDISSEDIERLLELTKEIIINNIDEENFISDKENISIDGVEYKLDKHSYVLGGNEYNKFISGILTDVKNNSEFINLIVKLFGSNKDNIVSKLEKLIDSVNEDVTVIKEEYIIYTKGLLRKVVGVGINSISTSEYGNDNEYITIKYFNIDNKYNFTLDEEYDDSYEEDYHYVISGKKEEDITRLTLKENDEVLANITYKSVGNTIEFTFSNPKTEDTFKLSLYSLVEDKLITSNISLEYTNNELYFKLNFNNSSTPIDNILKINYDNVVSIDELTDDELLLIENNLMNILSKSKLFGSYDNTINNLYEEDSSL